MSKLIVLLLTILWAIVLDREVVKAQQHNPSLEKLLHDLDSVIQKEQMPGLMISIVKKDSVLFAGGLGYADLEQETKVDQITQFHLASITKFFVAMGIQSLIAEGKLKLDDRLQHIAPEIKYTNKWEATDPVRIIHLLEHTSGFEDISINKMVNITGVPLKGIEAIQALENSFTSRWKPGKMMCYSNPGYNILGYVIEKVSGMPWQIYIQQAIFNPLSMTGSGFDLNGSANRFYAKGYDNGHEKQRLLPFYIPSSNGASSALVSSAADMAKFLHYLLNTNQYKSSDLLQEADLQEMEKIHSTLASQQGLQTGYALGNSLFPNNKKITFRGHNGKGEGFCSWLFFNREHGLAYTISTNTNIYLWPITSLIDGFLTQNIETSEVASVPIDKSKIEPLLGYYQLLNLKNERWEFHRRIFGGITLLSIEDDKLLVKKRRNQVDTLIHTGDGIFRMQNDIISSFVVGVDHEGHQFVQGYGDSFYSKTSYLPILLQKIPIYLGLIACLLTILCMLTSIFMLLFKKITWRDLLLVLLPTIGIASFFVSYRLLSITDIADKELFASANLTTISIFIGMLFFGLTVVTAVYLLISRWHIFNIWLKYIMSFNILFLLYLVLLLSIHGWIGVPIWLM